MFRKHAHYVILLGMLCVAPLAHTEEPIDWEMIAAIRDEGFNHSEVMETLEYLADTIGPRITNSPQMRQASVWAREKLTEWGLDNANLEPWGDFGRGWSFHRAEVHMVAPDRIPLIALPKAWTPGTDGTVRGAAKRVTMKTAKDFEKYKGELEGKVLLVDSEREIDLTENADVFQRYSEDELCDIEEFRFPEEEDEWRKDARKRYEFSRKLREFLIAEKPLALIELSSRDNGVVRVTGNRSYTIGEDPGPLQLAMIPEHYNRLIRLLKDDIPVELEINVEAEFHEDDPVGRNVIAEIPGTSKKDEVVMLGGHLDSWHAGTGATDNGAGVSVAMEAVRILKALDVQPKRTIRVVLWTGEEQGLLGSRGYVENHFASRPEPEEPEDPNLPRYLREQTWPITPKKAHSKLSAYYNLDNGSGKIRGIYAQSNSAVAPIFQTWLTPFADLGATTVTLRDTDRTDHVPFDRVGLPGFQFIQDPLEYLPRTHHSNLDVLDHVSHEDLMQASVIMASFVYHTAQRDELLPRKPMPKEPKKRDEPEEEDEESEPDTD